MGDEVAVFCAEPKQPQQKRKEKGEGEEKEFKWKYRPLAGREAAVTAEANKRTSERANRSIEGRVRDALS